MPFDLSLSREQIELKQKSHQIFTAIRDQHQSLSAVDRQTATIRDVWSALTDLGFLAFLIPGQYGGNNKGLMSSSIVMEELSAKGLHSFAPILTTMGAVSISRFGTETLRQRMLPQIAGGELKIAIAATEADAGFNVLNVKTFAENHGDHFVITGSKIYVSGVDLADYLLLVTRTMARDQCDQQGLPKTYGISLFLVETGAEGIERESVPSRGEGMMTQFTLQLSNVKVPANQLIGEEHKGAKVMFTMFNPERTLAAALGLGISRYCLDLACQHARARKVFDDTPIGAYQSIQHPLAEIAIRMEAVRLMTYRSAYLFDNNADPNELAESANSAKYLASELAIKAVDAAIDTFGGKGFDEVYGIIQLWEHARLLKTSPISNALILNQIAERTLNLPRSY